jgi:hypothetical protein
MLGGGHDRHGTQAQHEDGQPGYQRECAPDLVQDGEQVYVSSHA